MTEDYVSRSETLCLRPPFYYSEMPSLRLICVLKFSYLKCLPDIQTRMDGWMDEWMDGQTDRWIDR